ncbi:hypothetical protein J6590_047972 [Homalodisca vitripennis]|nr:hypothetical protein J6590_047972 [Homalodisca vitripennis]
MCWVLWRQLDDHLWHMQLRLSEPGLRALHAVREHNPAERTADQPKSKPPGFLFSKENTTQRRGQQINQSPNHQGFSFRKRTQPSGEDSRSTKVPNTRVSLFGREHSPAERAADQPKSKPPGFLFSKRTQPSGEDSRSTKVQTTRVSLFEREHNPAERTADQPKSKPPGFLFSEENTAQRRGQQVNQSPKHQGFSFRKRTKPSGEDSRSTKVPTTRVSFAERTAGGFNFNSRSEEASKRASLNSRQQRRVLLYPPIFVNFNRTGVQRV